MQNKKRWHIILSILLFTCCSESYISKGPYLQSLYPDQMMVIWETSEASDSKLVYSQNGNAITLQDGNLVNNHQITMSNLLPGVVYDYQIFSDGAHSASWSFLSMPTTGMPFTIGIIGDTHQNILVHPLLIAKMEKESPNILIHLGDMTDEGGNEDNWNRFFDTEITLLAKMPIYPVIGNHDYYSDVSGLNFNHYFPVNTGKYYSFNYSNSHFVILDSIYTSYTEEQIEEQKVWLENDLSTISSDIKYIFVATHFPAFNTGDTWVLENFVPILRQYNATVLFSGHYHHYERGQDPESNIVYFISGGGGGNLNCTYDETYIGLKAHACEHHYIRVDVTNEGLSFTTRNIFDEIIDQFELSITP